MKHQTKEEKELEVLVKEARELLADPNKVSANRYRKALVRIADKYESNSKDDSELQAKIDTVHDNILSGALPHNFERIKADGRGFKVDFKAMPESPERPTGPIGKLEDNPSGIIGHPGTPGDPGLSPEGPQSIIEIMPKSIWQDKRFKELKQAIIRCIEADFPVPNEWFAERTELLSIIKNRKK